MFGLFSHPIKLSDTTVDLEAEARDFQNSLMIRSMSEQGRRKNFRDMILERPKNPYATRATETLAMAIEENPLQDHGRPGVMVSELILLTGNSGLCLPVDLPGGRRAGVYIYSDLSCTLALPPVVDEMVRAITLPFKLRTARIRKHDPDSHVKVSVQVRGRRKRPGLYLQEDGLPAAVLDPDHVSTHAEFVADLATEIDAMVSQLETMAPIYEISPIRIPDSLKDHRGALSVPVGPGMRASLREDLLGWLNRGNISCHDVHLPFVNASIEQIKAARDLARIAASLAWMKVGSPDRKFPASLLIELPNPISGDFLMLRVARSTQDLMSERRRRHLDGHGRDEDEELRKRSALSQDFLNAFRDLFCNVVDSSGMDGYKYMYLKGQVGSWVPFMLDDIRINQIETEKSIEELEAILEFQIKRFDSVTRKRKEAFQGVLEGA